MNRAGPNSKISMSNKLKNYRRDIEIIQRDLVRITKSHLNDAIRIPYFCLKKKASTAAVNTNYGSMNPNFEVFQFAINCLLKIFI